MGKYMRNSNSNSNSANGTEISVNLMEITTMGVRTRAKTLALQQTQIPNSSSAAANSSSFSFLQLRSRRLLRLKPPIFKPPKNPFFNRIRNCAENPNLCNSSPAGSNSNSRVRVSIDSPNSGDEENNNNNVGDEFDDACFGENVVESDPRERESTPSNMIRDPDVIHAPGSTTRPVSGTQATRRLRSSTQRDVPTSHEMEEFFAYAEEQQQNDFIQKYNFDPVNDKPLDGRFEWKKVLVPDYVYLMGLGWLFCLNVPVVTSHLEQSGFEDIIAEQVYAFLVLCTWTLIFSVSPIESNLSRNTESQPLCQGFEGYFLSLEPHINAGSAEFMTQIPRCFHLQDKLIKTSKFFGRLQQKSSFPGVRDENK